MSPLLQAVDFPVIHQQAERRTADNSLLPLALYSSRRVSPTIQVTTDRAFVVSASNCWGVNSCLIHNFDQRGILPGKICHWLYIPSLGELGGAACRSASTSAETWAFETCCADAGKVYIPRLTIRLLSSRFAFPINFAFIGDTFFESYFSLLRVTRSSLKCLRLKYDLF